MLIEFRVENHRSIRDEQVVTMEAGRGGDASDQRPRKVPGHETPLLPAAAVYGANASGKSNLLAAMSFMGNAVMMSHRAWAPEGGVPREPFAWGTKTQEPSLFEVTILVDEVRYRYGFVADDERFLEEWLYAWPRGRKQTWFEREGDDFKFGDHLHGENRLVEQVTRPNALFLAAAVQHKHQQLAPIYWWFRSVGAVGGRRNRHRGLGLFRRNWFRRALAQRANGRTQTTLFEREEDGRLDSFRDLLQAADVGILDFKLESADEESSDRPPWRREGILVRHQSASEEAWLPLEEESQGTLTLFQLGPELLDVLHRGGLLVVDELEASLHPLLALRVLQQFNDPATNPRNAQLLFTTHDTNLLGTTTGETALRRDQVWLTEKSNEGATCAYPLTDYKPRKAENLERGYLQGRYGAIPFLGDLTRVPE